MYYVLAFALIVVLSCFLWRFPPSRKLIFIERSNVIADIAMLKISTGIYNMKKYIVILVIILLLAGTALGWFLFAWNGGLVGGAIIQWVKSATSFIWGKFLYISPFGRVKELSGKLKYAMIWSAVLCALGFLLSLSVLFMDGSRGFLKNLTFMEMAVAEFFISWYIMYPICLLVIKINVLYKVLSAVALIVSFVIIKFILIAQMIIVTDIG